MLKPSVPTIFTETANLFKNKIAVADIHSTILSSNNLAALQAPLFGLSGTKLLTQIEATDFLVNNGFLIRVNTDSATLNEMSIGQLGGPIGLIGIPDTFSLNIISAGTGETFNIGNNISVVLGDAAGTTAGGNAETFTLNAVMYDSSIDTMGIEGLSNLNFNDINAQTISVAGVENLKISATFPSINEYTQDKKPAIYTLSVNFIANDAETITITGNSNVDLSPGILPAGTIGNVSEINAAGSTGYIRIDFSAHEHSVRYTGSDGADYYNGSTEGDIISGGKGTDSFYLEPRKSARDIVVLNTATDSQIVDWNNDGMVTLDENHSSFTGSLSYDEIKNFKGGNEITDDRIDLSSFGFIDTQHGIVDASVQVPDIVTDLTNIPDLFNSSTGDRSVAFLKTMLPVPVIKPSFDIHLLEPVLFLFVDANKDGNFTAADDMVIGLVGLNDFSETDLVF